MSLPLITLGVSTWPLVDGLERLHGPVTVVRRCLDLAELLAAARTGLARAVLVAEGAEELTASLAEQLRLGGAVLLVLEGHDARRLAALGAVVVPEAAGPEETARLVETAVADGARAPGTAGYAEVGAATGGGAVPDGAATRAGEDAAEPPAATGPRGPVVAVWGPTGAPGRPGMAKEREGLPG